VQQRTPGFAHGLKAASTACLEDDEDDEDEDTCARGQYGRVNNVILTLFMCVFVDMTLQEE
jgi:hypothetical protein